MELLMLNIKFSTLREATNPRFVVLQNNHYFCIGYTSFLRLDGVNIEWNMNIDV